MPACRHGHHLRCRRCRLGRSRLRQRANPQQHLRGAKAALARKAPPIFSPEAITAVLAADPERKISGDVLSHLCAHDVIERRQAGAAGLDHDRIVLGMRVGVAGNDVEDHHVEQSDDIVGGQ